VATTPTISDLVALHGGRDRMLRVPAFVLDASHHGSRSFFKVAEEDEPHLDALKAIDPDYVVISAPAKGESKFDHPHDDAVALYADHVGADNVLHTGSKRESFFFDIYDEGSHGGPQTDGGKLAENYGLGKGTGNDGGGGKSSDSQSTVEALRRAAAASSSRNKPWRR
jgi:hypothetical protein